MPGAGDRKRSFFEAIRSYAEERRRPRVCPVCGQAVTPIGDGKLFACTNASCGWEGTTPDRG
jgi:hypothetical protein